MPTLRKTPVDNLKQVHQDVAQRVLQSHVSAFCRRDRLELIAAGEGDSPSMWSFLAVRFDRAGTSCELYVEAEPRVARYDDVDIDSDGNEWHQLMLRFKVNYPAHGSDEPSTVLARAALIHDVALLASELKAEWHSERKIWKLVRTAAEIKEAEHKAFLQKQDDLARQLVERVGMKLRLGKDTWTDDLPEGLVPGTRYVEVFPRSKSAATRRKFTVTVHDPARGALIQRTA